MLPPALSELSMPVRAAVHHTRLDTIGRWGTPQDSRDPLIHAYIVFKELGLILPETLGASPLDVHQRGELAQVLLAACTELQHLMQSTGHCRDHGGQWFLSRTKEWATQPQRPEFAGLSS